MGFLALPAIAMLPLPKPPKPIFKKEPEDMVDKILAWDEEGRFLEYKDININPDFVMQFRDNLILESRQIKSRLRPFVKES